MLTSRAIQKMLLVSSASLLDHVPRTRRMIGPAARLRGFAHDYCNASGEIYYTGEPLTMRWHDPAAASGAVATLPLVTDVPRTSTPAKEEGLGATPTLSPE